MKNPFANDTNSEGSEFIISLRAVCEPRMGPSELQTHLYLYISDGVRHDVTQNLTSWRIFVSMQHLTQSEYELPSMTKALTKSCLFIVCNNNVYYR